MSGNPSLSQRIQQLEAAVESVQKRLSEIESKKPAETNGKKCGWKTLDGVRFFLPQCWGGVLNGQEGCYCK